MSYVTLDIDHERICDALSDNPGQAARILALFASSADLDDCASENSMIGIWHELDEQGRARAAAFLRGFAIRLEEDGEEER